MYYVVAMNDTCLIEQEKPENAIVLLETEHAWKAHEFVDNLVLAKENIRDFVGNDINVGKGNLETITSLINIVERDTFEKIALASLGIKAERQTDARLTNSTCNFINGLVAKYGEVPYVYRVYEHPCLWNDAIQLYMQYLYSIKDAQ